MNQAEQWAIRVAGQLSELTELAKSMGGIDETLAQIDESIAFLQAMRRTVELMQVKKERHESWLDNHTGETT